MIEYAQGFNSLCRNNKNTHSQIINYLEKTLRAQNRHDLIEREKYILNKSSETYGECDLYAIRKLNGKFYAKIYEVKKNLVNENLRKVKKQLEKDVNFLRSIYGKDLICKTYVVCDTDLTKTTRKIPGTTYQIGKLSLVEIPKTFINPNSQHNLWKRLKT